MDIALLGSRKPRHIPPDAWWLRTTFALARDLAGAGHRLCASVGNLPYDTALHGVAREGGRLLVFTGPRHLEYLHACLVPRFDEADLEIRMLPRADGAARDRAVIDAADLCIAVAIRSGGLMARLLLDRWRGGRPVQVVEPPVQPGSGSSAHPNLPPRNEIQGNLDLLAAGVPPLAPDMRKALESCEPLRPALDPAPPSLLEAFPRWERSPLDGPILAHFTRACPGPWPSQPRWAYLEDLYHGGWRSQRDARATLMHILEERRIRASSRLIRGQYPVVSFTEHGPEAVADLHRYRRHLIRWDFQPFGLVFDRGWLEARGARPVRYLSDAAFKKLPEKDKPWFQKHQPPSCDYTEEREWRFRGDLDFAAVPPEACRIVCPLE